MCEIEGTGFRLASSICFSSLDVLVLRKIFIFVQIDIQ